MASLQDIRRRIRSVKNTQQVTKAMKMISAVKLRKSQERLVAMRPYATMLHKVVGQVVARIEPDENKARHPLAQAFLSPREEKNIHLVIIGSDKGLCGGYNTNLLKAVEVFLKEHDCIPGDAGSVRASRSIFSSGSSSRKSQSKVFAQVAREMSETGAGDSSAEGVISVDALTLGCECRVVTCDAIGRRAVEWVKKTDLPLSLEAVSLNPSDYMKTAREISERAIQEYTDGEIDGLYLVYNYFNSAVAQTPRATRVFPPLEKYEADGIQHLLEPDPEIVLEAVLPHFVETEIYRAILESAASEHAARMAAMDKATSNAYEMIDKLTLHMNKVRQAAITNQIIEVVSGAAS